MNRTLYYDLVVWLNERRYREDMDEWTKNILLTTGQQYETQGNILYRKQGILVPVIREDKIRDILRLAHDHPLAGHMGQQNTYNRLKGSAWWPGMHDDVTTYVRNCDICQKRARTRKENPKSSSAIIRPEPFSHIGIDTIGPLPITITGKRYILLAIDYFTKYAEAAATEESDAQTVVKFLHSDVICRHGVPKEITSDRGTEFLNELVQEFEQVYHIKHIRTTAYHPQGNGQTERANQTIKNILAKVIQTENAWDHYLDSALFAFRTIRQDSTRFSPFELVYGRRPQREYDHHFGPEIGTYEDRLWTVVMRDIRRLQKIRKDAATFIEKAQERQRLTMDKKTTAAPLSIGDKVLIYRNITESSWSAKLQPKWEGPYYIRNIKEQNVWLRRLNGSILPSAIHRSKVKKYHE